MIKVFKDMCSCVIGCPLIWHLEKFHSEPLKRFGLMKIYVYEYWNF